MVSIVSVMKSGTCHGSRVWSAWDMFAVWKRAKLFLRVAVAPVAYIIPWVSLIIMAESFPPAWISDYLIDVAETHGAQLYDAPLFNKKKRVQLTEVELTPRTRLMYTDSCSVSNFP